MIKKEFRFTNPAGEKVQVILEKCENPGGKHSLPRMWYKEGLIDHILQTYWYMEVYVTDVFGNCWGKYNPTIIEGKNKIDFRWMMEATEENAKLLIDECMRRAGGRAE